jgi:hypothetical protein
MAVAMKIEIDRDVYRKIMYWVNKSQYEVSGFGNVVLGKDGTFRVISAMLTKQANSSAETDIKAEDVAKALFESRLEEGEMRWWWHSHVNMNVFWSGTDHQAMRDFASTPESWIICTVFNKKEEKRSAYFAPQGCDTPWGRSVLMFDELPTAIVDEVDNTADWDAEYETKVTNTYANYKHQWAGKNNLDFSKRPAAQRPPGISKKDWKALKKKEADQKTEAEKDKQPETKEVTVQGLSESKSEKSFDLDEYGFSQVDRTLLSHSGWTLNDIDSLVARGFVARQMMMMCEADYLADDILKFLEAGETVFTIMKDVSEILKVRDDVLGNLKPEEPELVDDDIPVADRSRNVIDMRQGNFEDIDDYRGYGHRNMYD